MANKVIQFTVSADGEISPKVEQAAGGQGSHNVTEVEFDVSGLTSYYDLNNPKINKVRIQFIDGAGGFESTEFLTVKENKVSTLLSRRLTNAGGAAKVYLVVTKITYDGDGVAHEEEVYMSQGGKLRFDGSGVGSPSNDIYLKGISSALVNAEIFVGQAESSASEAKESKDEAKVFATEASNARDAAETSELNASKASFQALQHAQTASNSAEEVKKALGDVGNIECVRKLRAGRKVLIMSATLKPPLMKS